MPHMTTRDDEGPLDPRASTAVERAYRLWQSLDRTAAQIVTPEDRAVLAQWRLVQLQRLREDRGA